MNLSILPLLVLLALSPACPACARAPLHTTAPPRKGIQPNVASEQGQSPVERRLTPHTPAASPSVPGQEDIQAAMPVEELDPSHYPATRAAKVAEHFINTRYGSPFAWFGSSGVKKAGLEDMGVLGTKYHIEFTLKEMTRNQDMGLCSAEVLFHRADERKPPQVQCTCSGAFQVNTSAEEEDLYQRLRNATSLLSGSDIPNSVGHIDPEMAPFWHLGGVASSFIMLRESNESTLLNMAHIDNFTQMETKDAQLMFQYDILLHDMVSQEILKWKLLLSWSPDGGVKVLEAEWDPKCRSCERAHLTVTTGIAAEQEMKGDNNNV
ncbi:latexin isoform X3 [Denticeps clupeoides]|uniref:latexin isoform X3 n=1 Tax=Denticeps clupeoides TaxID=299321 RepID=UPI0010A43D58|nr:latexin-like isoform X3 [Denticeps clupeoides]